MPTKPKTWTTRDIPSPAEMEAFLAHIKAARDAFPGVVSFPPLPPDMEELTFEEANDIERILSIVDETIKAAGTSIVFSGEFQSGGY